MMTERKIRLTNRSVLFVGVGEGIRGKESSKGEEKVKDNPVSEGDMEHPKLLRNIAKEGATKADQEGDKQE